MNIVETRYKNACEKVSDINEHIPTLKRYADLCEHVTEFGVRTGVSTWAWIMSNAKIVRSYDSNGCYLADHEQAANEIKKEFSFTLVNVLADKFEIEPTDLLFIDTDHTYNQCSQELKKHSNKVRKFIIFHDTVTFGAELNKAIEEFLDKNRDWMVRETCFNNNGLTVLAKK
jgi:glycogen synthase